MWFLPNFPILSLAAQCCTPSLSRTVNEPKVGVFEDFPLGECQRIVSVFRVQDIWLQVKGTDSKQRRAGKMKTDSGNHNSNERFRGLIYQVKCDK